MKKLSSGETLAIVNRRFEIGKRALRCLRLKDSYPWKVVANPRPCIYNLEKEQIEEQNSCSVVQNLICRNIVDVKT